MQNFVYNIPTKIYFGKDEELRVGKLIKEYHAKKVLIHFGSNRVKKNGLLPRIEKCLKQENIKYIELGGVTANPILSFVKKGITLAKKEKVDLDTYFWTAEPEQPVATASDIFNFASHASGKKKSYDQPAKKHTDHKDSESYKRKPKWNLKI